MTLGFGYQKFSRLQTSLANRTQLGLSAQLAYLINIVIKFFKST